MGVNQPNKRGADQAGKKGKPARKAAVMQSTASASKPADAAAPSSSSSSLLLQVMPHVSSIAACAVCFVCVLFLHLFLCPPNVSRSGCQRSGTLEECVKSLPCCECGHTDAPHVCPSPNAGPSMQHLLLRHSGAVSFAGMMHMCAWLSPAECIACGVTCGPVRCVCKRVKQYSNRHGHDAQGGGGQSGAAPAGASLLEHTGVAQQAAPAAQRTAQRTAQTLSPLPRPGKHSRSDTTGQVSGAIGDSPLQLLGTIKVHDCCTPSPSLHLIQGMHDPTLTHVCNSRIT